MSSLNAKRILVTGERVDVALREAVCERARQLGLRGWVRLTDDGGLSAHVEGESTPFDALVDWLALTVGSGAFDQASVKVEGHEQFAIRGVSAGVFVVQEHQATAHHFDLRLEVDGVMRSWAVPKGPSMDPAVKRMALQVEDHQIAHNSFEGRTGGGAVIVWDRGEYEQGGRVPWPQALDRGHAVFVLHGEKLTGGFALQRTRGGEAPQWLLIKRRDQWAQPGSDVVADQPRSVESGRKLADLT